MGGRSGERLGATPMQSSTLRWEIAARVARSCQLEATSHLIDEFLLSSLDQGRVLSLLELDGSETVPTLAVLRRLESFDQEGFHGLDQALDCQVLVSGLGCAQLALFRHRQDPEPRESIPAPVEAVG